MIIDYEDIHRNSLNRQLNAELLRAKSRKLKLEKQARDNAIKALKAFKRAKVVKVKAAKIAKVKRKIAVKYSKKILGVTLPKTVKFIPGGFYTDKRYI